MLADVVGQEHLIGPGKPLAQLIAQQRMQSMILWGPPGSGKTTLARILADASGATVVALSAVLAGVKDVREAVARAEQDRRHGIATVLFVDEVHRFNKAQQDAFLPHVERGTLTFIGATTENPSFEVNAALLSRARVFVLRPLDETALESLVRKVADALDGREITSDAIAELVASADGDARRCINAMELAAQLTDGVIEAEVVRLATGSSYRWFDKGGDAFYDQISALHKSVRGSDPDAALYWFVRMVDGGCDPRYIARRVLRMASEDVGNADPRALQIALAGWETYDRLGSPEGELALAQAVVYLASVPKSNACYTAYGAAKRDVADNGSLPVPERLRNAPTRLAQSLGHGRGYRYAHDEQGAFAAGERYFPDGMADRQYYAPTEQGLEARIGERLRRLRALNEQARKTQKSTLDASQP